MKKRGSSQSESDDDFNPISDEEDTDLDDEDNYYEDADFGECFTRKL